MASRFLARLALLTGLLLPGAAHAQYTLHRTGTAPHAVPEATRTTLLGFIGEIEPNNGLATAQRLTGPAPIVVEGRAEVADEGDFTIEVNNLMDDLEDLYVLTLSAPGLRVTLSVDSSDCDVYLIDEAFTTVIVPAVNPGLRDELIDEPELAAGTYHLAVTIWDRAPGGPPQTPYTLTVEGMVAGSTPVEEAPALPAGFTLSANYPNPFNPETRIDYHLAETAPVTLDVYDPLGRRVRTLVAVEQAAGTYSVRWDGRTEAGVEAPTGLYVYRLQAGAFRQARTMVLLR